MSCDENIRTHGEALRLLALAPSCTDAAVEALERFAPTDARAMSDLAAAYYVRAQRLDQPSDLLRSLDAAEKAAASPLNLPEATFNRALALEALGFFDDALPLWESIRTTDSPQWAEEAAAHRRRLVHAPSISSPSEWPAVQAGFATAINAGDRAKLVSLIEPYITPAERYLERELFTKWLADPAPARLAQLQLFAAAWSEAASDPYAMDLVANAAQAAVIPAKLAALRKAEAFLEEAPKESKNKHHKESAELYERASRLLTQVGSPFQFLNRTRVLLELYAAGEDKLTLRKRLENVARDDESHHYDHLRLETLSTRGYFLYGENQLIESLDAYGVAVETAARLGDRESFAVAASRRAGMFGALGESELAWRDAFRTLPIAPFITTLQQRHVLLGEAADSARDLGFPGIAIRYQEAAIRHIRKELVVVPPERLGRIAELTTNLSIALRHLSELELQSGAHDKAATDLQEAIRLAAADPRRAGAPAAVAEAEGDRNEMQARLEEIRGRQLRKTNFSGAIGAFTQALERSKGANLQTFRASLYAQRADAERAAGNVKAAERDLEAAIAEINAEEAAILDTRKPGQGEAVWSAYFSRFQEVYRLLIRQLVEDGRGAEAFAYDEKSRAFELLDLIRKAGVVSGLGGKSMELSRIQASLPADTFIIQYRVLEDRTYAWIVGRDRISVLNLNAGRADVEQWSDAVKRAARRGNSVELGRSLNLPFNGLIAAPREAIARMTDGREPRLVFVPDGAMHGLPFAALRDPVTREYLLEHAVVSIAGSATLHVVSRLRDAQLSKDSAPVSALLIGNPRFDPHLEVAHDLGTLPGAELEVKEIAKLYAPNADVRIGADATVPDLLERAKDKTIVHIAAHSIVNAREPHRSLILLAPSPGSSGAMEAQKLLTLKLDRTRLIVLAACSSAGGIPVGPEGVAPLVRPLIAAGVPAVVGSLWNVNDATAEPLLVSFHRYFRQGMDAEVALQQAQLHMLRKKDAGQGPALVWAAFEVIGHTSSPFAPTPAN